MESQEEYLSHIERLDTALEDLYDFVLSVDTSLTRQLVSFQANKQRPFYRWYKYKEAYSADLIAYLLRTYKVRKGTLLDPFAGVGTTLFAGSKLGYDADGIELLPIGQHVIAAHEYLLHHITDHELSTLKTWRDHQPWQHVSHKRPLNTLRITRGAYPEETEAQIGHYLAAADKESETVNYSLVFALLCVLESMSYTRKDGQYLRWDYRSGRNAGKKKFDKGQILTFEDAIQGKLSEIIFDIENNEETYNLFQELVHYGAIQLHKGSCLDILPTLPSTNYTAIITSPPYCNRYDYTRTYALEHALLGITEKGLVKLRQTMLSCTVENRAKDLLTLNTEWKEALEITDNQPLLQSILAYLEYQRTEKKLNNSGISRMVRGYFYEMACVIAECFRVLDTDGVMCMVNDNVRYAGASISVDLILSNIAEEIGFTVENILVLPQGKGNSSQQMGGYGRKALRKCIYVWRKRP
ncbi:DNA modification methylase [candidate division KSB3 bacterium]|uniref:site-specific DNA-methyltransferase (cytosine-N(4)-specific) n=1 Tax=candidate division KSB3 bacterium TaxID=2044937 RepID=A0A2G6K6L1_9BACT|nr:MAG: DNA modification methylase [candidate division KSB3 bacterium]